MDGYRSLSSRAIYIHEGGELSATGSGYLGGKLNSTLSHGSNVSGKQKYICILSTTGSKG